jgi:hypothetical protein
MEPYFDLGIYTRGTSTASTSAQMWFDRGLVWSYAFHHEEAIRCFERAVEHDPGFALAHWGIAYAAGANYNKPFWHRPAPRSASRSSALPASCRRADSEGTRRWERHRPARPVLQLAWAGSPARPGRGGRGDLPTG